MQDALHGELVRRQELLRAAGNYGSAAGLREGPRRRGAGWRRCPACSIVVDEFSELLAAKPRLHRPVRDDRPARPVASACTCCWPRSGWTRAGCAGWRSHLSYRIGLRTFSAMESRAVLGVPDAYELPTAPGHGYLKCRHRRRWSGSRPRTCPAVRYRRARRQARAARQAPVAAERPMCVGHVRTADSADPRPSRRRGDRAGADEPRLLDVIVDRLRGARPAGAPGVAAAAGRTAHPGPAAARRWPADPAARPVAPPAEPRRRRLQRAGRPGRPAVRAAPRPADGRPGRRPAATSASSAARSAARARCCAR